MGERVEVEAGDEIVVVAPAAELTAGEAVEVLVEARLAEEHAAEALEEVEELQERVEECQTETQRRLSDLENRVSDLPTRSDLEQSIRALLSDLHPAPLSPPNPTLEEPAEILETLAESPETLEAASRETGLSETTISETLTEASSETKTEAPESDPAVVLVETAPPVQQNRVRFV